MKKIGVLILILVLLLSFTWAASDSVSDENGLMNNGGGLGNNGVKENDPFGLLVSFLVLGILLLILFLANKNLLPKTKKEKIIERRKGQDAGELNKCAKKVLKLLEKHKAGLTQKEILYEMVQVEESKVSLVLAELEYMGKIKKIKKGRKNIIILKEQ